jgi:pyridoxine 5-phosphate synthase
VGIFVSLFLDPQRKQIELAREVGGQAVELHTGSYAHARTAAAKKKELDRLVEAGRLVVSRGMRLDAGHGLTYSNVQSIAGIPDLAELNIGHSIVSRSIFVGMTQAVREMKELIFRAHAHRAMIAD